MSEVKLTCISCPVGCQITVQMDGDKIIAVTGNSCPRGEAYARQEVIAPQRVIATSVKVDGGELPLVSVKTDKPIPKQLIPQLMKYVKSLAVAAPIAVGQVLARDVLGTDANLVATRKVGRQTTTVDPALLPPVRSV